MKKNNLTFVLLYMIPVLFLSGCVAPPIPRNATAAQTTPNTERAATTIPEQTRKPYPTLSSDVANEKLRELLINNSNCRLPCWWGITPGKTTWNEALLFLNPLIKRIGEPTVAPSGLTRVTFQLPVQKELGTLDQTYYVRNNTVVGINAYVFDWSPFLYLSNILTEYGPPDGVFITTYRYDENGRRPYIVYVIYEKLGMLLLYSGGEPKNLADNVENCFDNLYAPFVFIWSVEDEPLSESQIKDRYFSSEGMPYPISLEKSAGMSVNTFYAKFKKPSDANCLVTSAELWPEP